MKPALTTNLARFLDIKSVPVSWRVSVLQEVASNIAGLIPPLSGPRIDDCYRRIVGELRPAPDLS
jgi:hypothetical protein